MLKVSPHRKVTVVAQYVPKVYPAGLQFYPATQSVLKVSPHRKVAVGALYVLKVSPHRKVTVGA